MKEEIAALDLVALMNEIGVLEGARIDKFYQKEGSIVMHAYKPGDRKYRLFLSSGKAFLTGHKREMPEKPPGFCMFLRKMLAGKTIERVEQYDFDRVLVIHTDEHILICELFRNGNFILTNRNMEVESSLRSGDFSGREIYSGETYEFPEETPSPDSVGRDNLRGEDSVVVGLASGAGLGGFYAEEVCARAGVEKDTPMDELSGEEREMVVEEVRALYSDLREGKLDPRVYHGEGPVAATPVPFETYESFDSEPFEIFSAALDSYFTEREKREYRARKEEVYRDRKEELERRLEQQERKLEGLKKSVEENREKGDLIYENYSLVEDIIESLRAAQKNHSLEEIEERLESERSEGIPEAEAIERLELDRQEVVVDLGEEVRINIQEGVEINAERYYEKSKDSRGKIEGTEEALERTREELESLEMEDIDVDEAFKDKEGKKEEREWYEKFRWFFSSDGFLVIGGRDATTNDMVVKKYMEDHDVYVHAEFTGAPSVVIKTEGEEVPQSTLKEAGQFAVTFARAWEAGVTSEDAYWVEPGQVTQEAESGEYLPRGSFVIRGERNYMKNIPVEAALGAYERDGGYVPMGGPPGAVREHCSHYLVLGQGRDRPSDVAKSAKEHLDESVGASLDLDAIIRALPPGNSEIRERV